MSVKTITSRLEAMKLSPSRLDEKMRDFIIKNLSLWEKIWVSDPKYVKDIPYSKFKGKTANANWQRLILKSIFGPAGIGWGTEDEKYDFVGDTIEDKRCVYSMKLWYVIPDEKEIFGDFAGKRGVVTAASSGQVFEYVKSKQKWIVVDHLIKKLRTDCITKGSSEFGLSMDIFLDSFDEQRYNGEGDGKEIPDPTPKRSAGGNSQKKQLAPLNYSGVNKKRIIKRLEEGWSVSKIIQSCNDAGFSISQEVKNEMEEDYKMIMDKKNNE
jgi:hypothetical protein